MYVFGVERAGSYSGENIKVICGGQLGGEGRPSHMAGSCYALISVFHVSFSSAREREGGMLVLAFDPTVGGFYCPVRNTFLNNFSWEICRKSDGYSIGPLEAARDAAVGDVFERRYKGLCDTRAAW